MTYSLCAAHRGANFNDYSSLIRYTSHILARGNKPFGPWRTMEAESVAKVRDDFLQEYGRDFDYIGCDGDEDLIIKTHD